MENLDFERDKELLSRISRDKYEEVFDILSDNIWEYGGGISFKDLKEGAETLEIKNNNLINALDSEKDIVDLLSKDNLNYTSEDSEDFIRKVKASNVKEISESGYFYKKLASSMDSVKTVDDDCGSEGKLYLKEDILNDNISDFFEYRIKNLYIVETGKTYSLLDDFIEDISAIDSFRVRTPIECKHAKDRNFCSKCCGDLNTGNNKIDPRNIGIIATLAITENVTQGALNTMNDGMEENVNIILEKPFPIKRGYFEEYKEIIEGIIDIMEGVGVQSRWYEIALIGRTFKTKRKKDGKIIYSSTSFKSSSNYSVDPLGRFLFSPRIQNLKSLLKSNENIDGESSFEINSCKAENLFNLY